MRDQAFQDDHGSLKAYTVMVAVLGCGPSMLRFASLVSADETLSHMFLHNVRPHQSSN